MQADTAPLWARWKGGGDAAAREQLICHYLPYARLLAATLFGRRTHGDVEFEDYLQLARIGLIEAVDRFDPGQGAQFKTYASKRIQGAMLNGLMRLTEKNQQISVRVRLRQDRLEAVKEAAGGLPARRDAGELFRYLAEVGIGLALGVLLEDTGMIDADAFETGAHIPSPEVSYFRKSEIRQLRDVLQVMLDRLSDQQRQVIRCHYLQELPFDEIALDMGVTRGRISQLHRQALLKLRELLASEARCDVSC